MILPCGDFVFNVDEWNRGKNMTVICSLLLFAYFYGIKGNLEPEVGPRIFF